MAADNGRKKTFSQKAGRFFRRLTLTAAFAAAAGAGYNFYGTQEDVTAKVTSVEPGPGGDIIHTDKGAFANTATWVFSKTPSDVQGISDKMVPGATVRMHVYGIHPQIAGHTPDDVGFYRNITDARVMTPPAPAVQPAPPVTVAPQPVVPAHAPKTETALIVPPDLINSDGVDKEDVMAPEACVKNANFSDINTKAPRLARDLDIMRQLPLTGTQVFDMLKNPKNGIQTCLIPVPPKTPSFLSTYDNNKHARIGRGTGTSTTFHEYYHAMQNITGGRNDMFTLTEKDGAVANLLTEASAVAYEIAARQEAVDHGLKFYDPPVYTETHEKNGYIYTETYTESAPSTNPENIKAFKDAYDASLASTVGQDDETREAAALQAGGQAVVRRLLQGKDADWNQTNTDLVVKNINRNLDAFDADDTAPSYGAQRDLVFRNQGAVLKKINFIPDEYLGPGANKAIDDAFTALGFQLKPVQPANTQAPSGPQRPSM